MACALLVNGPMRLALLQMTSAKVDAPQENGRTLPASSQMTSAQAFALLADTPVRPALLHQRFAAACALRENGLMRLV